MSWELQKLFGSRFVALLLLGAAILNGVLFYNHCTDDAPGYTLLEMKEKYESQESLEAELELLEAWAMDPSQELEGVRLVAKDPFAERRLILDILGRMEEIENYPDYRKQIQTEALARMRFGLVGDPGSAPYRGQERVAEIYGNLEGLIPENSFSGGVEVLTQWRVTELLLLLFGLVGGLFLLVQERRTGTLMLLRSTRHGRARLYLQKYAAMLALLILGAVVLYGTNLTLSAILLGLGNLNRPIQSVQGFLACPVPFTVLGFLITMYLEKLIWLWMCSSLFFLLCVRPSGAAVPMVVFAAVAGLGVYMANSTNLWLRSLSPVAMADSAARYQRCLMLPLGNIPVAEQFIVPLVCGVLGLGSFFGGLWLFCTGATVPVDAVSTGRPTLHHTSLLRFETYKVFLYGGGLVVLAVMLLTQLLIYRGYSTQLSIYQERYTHYARILEGPPTVEKEDFLEAENQRFVQLEEKIARFRQEIQDEMVFQQVTAEYTAQLTWRETFQDVELQYRSLEAGQSFVPRLGYEYLFGRQGQRAALRSLALLFLVQALALSGVMAREEETGVGLFQNTFGVVRQVNRRKYLACGILTLLLATAAFLPEWLYVNRMFGLTQLGAVSSSLPILSKFGGEIPIYGVVILVWALWFAAALLAAAWILFLSAKTKRTIPALLVSIGTLVIPALIGLLLMQ